MLRWKYGPATLVLGALFWVGTLHSTRAEDTALIRGDAVVTGFSGVRTADTAPSADAIDETFIDLDGASVKVLPLDAGAPPSGQVLSVAPRLEVKARDVGQVFAVGLDDGLKPDPTVGVPNIYLGATSAYGLQIVIPDADGDGHPERVKEGHPNAEWMAGQFGPGGGPGSIWKVDGATRTVSLFATVPGNSGPGLGDIAFDQASLHFFVSDLDTGLIHRIDSAGNLVDTFDHGIAGREKAGLSAVADDGSKADIKEPAFDSMYPATWGFTQPERRVWGLAVDGGRLYYAVAGGPEVWSVSIGLDGAFGSDARREFEMSGTPGNHPISDIAFDGQGMMYVAQRGVVRGSYDYAAFSAEKASVVFRYRREIPDDPATPGSWVPVPDEFAVGFPPDHRNTAGGVALGYGYDESGRMRTGTCGATLWATGDNLRVSDTNAAELEAGGGAIVHGLQGTDRLLVRPDHEPPMKSYFVDYDGGFEDPQKIGHVGDVEIWQPCDKASFGYGPDYAPMPYLPPDYVPPSSYPPGYVPSGEPPVGWGWDFNLRVDKAAVPFACTPGGAGFLCSYTVRVTNTGSDPYIGPVTLQDTLPAAPAGASMSFNEPPWACIPGTPTDYSCTYPMAVLWPGTSIDLKVEVDTPAPAPVCSLDNLVHIKWPWGFGDSNPGDDFAGATAGIPAAHCPPVAGEKANLKIEKYPIAGQTICWDMLGHFECPFGVRVTNTGPGIYNGKIKFDEIVPNGATVSSGAVNCSGAAPVACETGPLVLSMNQGTAVVIKVRVPKNLADDLSCKVVNKVKITDAPGGSDQNSDATDDEAQAEMILPGTEQQCPDLKLSNLKIKKVEATGAYCPPVGGNWECKFKITVQNFGKAMHNDVRFIDALPPGAPAGTTASFQTPLNWQCNLAFFPLYVCQTGNAQLEHLEKVDILATVKVPIHPTTKCSIKNTAQIIAPAAPAAQNTFGGDDQSDATAYFETISPMGGDPFCAHPPGPPPSPVKTEANLSISKTAGASTVTAAGQTTPFVITVTNTGPGVYAGPIVVRETLPGEPENASWSDPWVCEGQTMAGQPNDALCTHPAVALDPGDSVTLNLDVEMPNSLIAPSGSQVTCGYTNKVAIEAAAGGTPQNTNAGDDTATADVHFAPFETHGQKFCGIGDFTPPPPPPPTCPQGWSSTPVAGKCCPPRTAWDGKRCVRDLPPGTCKPKTCSRHQVWDVGVCRCVDLQCPNGTVGTYPNCKPTRCPDGYRGTPPNCERIVIVDPPPRCPPNSDERFRFPDCRCKPGLVGKPPNCRLDPPKCTRKSCGRNATWDSASCSCVPKQCPEGTVGKYPNCRQVPTTCGPGFRGTPPNCTKIIVEPTKCPEGYTGRPPKCKKDPPPKCPKGFAGTPPNCKRVVVDPPRTCPPGMVGKPPNCRKKPEPPKRCPSGFTGTPPKCKLIRVPKVKPLQLKAPQIKSLPGTSRPVR
ncbi:hypothetical protein [Hyphomicrobium sp.]|uniref:hypothetical protein n=1 Tax=Hyphomicrobium sp. TaxID=82 RepID=UPI0025B9C185|nr:hypothetical protein [Hyphomicrobium sp.]MCC7250965.1 hypothetical protein [Hyphomicrobium sp.]